jgi:predicted NUDIX family NTP pyrophosphohydrolase
MAKESAGLLIWRRRAGALEVLLVHPGGPFWKNKDLGAWSIPKGEIDAAEDPESAARREVAEETGLSIDGPLMKLASIRQKGHKIVHAWAVEADCDPAAVRSNSFSMMWPPRSGKFQDFPEIDRAAWFALEEARARINPAQVALIDELATKIG